MDQSQFDDFTRTLAGSTSRRQALKLLGTSIVGAMIAAFGGSTAQAARSNRSYCLDICKNTEGIQIQDRGLCMSTCMPCDLDTSYICFATLTTGLAIACCPNGQGCALIGGQSVCHPF